MPVILKTGRLMRFSFRRLLVVRSASGPFTVGFESGSCGVEFLTQDAAKGRGFTTFAMYLLCTPYDVGIETARILTPNYLFWPHISAIDIFPEITARSQAAFGDVIPRRIQR